MAISLTAAVAFIVTTSALYFALKQFDRYRRTVRGRLHSLGEEGTSTKRDSESNANRNANAILRLLPELENRDALKKRLASAGYHKDSAPDFYVLCQVVAVIVMVVFMAALVGSGRASGSVTLLVITAISSAACCHAPSAWLRHATQQRRKIYRKSLPDFLDLMVVCLDGGMSLPFTLKRASRELQLVHPELASELLAVQRDTEMGASLERSLSNFAQRTGDDEIKTLSLFVGEAQRHGSSITEALREHADFMRSQRETAAEELAQKASVKILLPLLVLILPAVFVVVAGPAFIQLSEAFVEK